MQRVRNWIFLLFLYERSENCFLKKPFETILRQIFFYYLHLRVMVLISGYCLWLWKNETSQTVKNFRLSKVLRMFLAGVDLIRDFLENCVAVIYLHKNYDHNEQLIQCEEHSHNAQYIFLNRTSDESDQECHWMNFPYFLSSDPGSLAPEWSVSLILGMMVFVDFEIVEQCKFRLWNLSGRRSISQHVNRFHITGTVSNWCCRHIGTISNTGESAHWEVFCFNSFPWNSCISWP